MSNTSSIWDSTNPDIDPSDQPIELGVKFQSEIDGIISGVRFHKATVNIGIHTGTLWSSTGQELATATFADETDSGWQQVNFAAPVPITAGTTYLASYHTEVGHFEDTDYAFISGFSHPPLRVLADGECGENGVYAVGAHSFPTESYHARNYWVDVVFTDAVSPVEPALKSVVVVAGTGMPDGPETKSLSMGEDPTMDEPIDDGTVGPNFPVENNYLQIGLQFRVLKPVKFCGCRLWVPSEEIAVSSQKTVWLWDLKRTAKAADIITPTLVHGWNEIHLKDADQVVLAPGDYVVSTVFHAAYPSQNNYYREPKEIGDFAKAIMGVYDQSNNQPNGVIPTTTFESSNYYVDILLKSTGADASVKAHEHVEHYPTFKENFNLDGAITDFLVKGTYQDIRVMAYTDKESVNVGETIGIKGSSNLSGNVKIEIIRVGYYGGEGGKVVDTTTVPFTSQMSNETLTPPDGTITKPLVKRCQWSTAYSYNVPTDAISGVYYIRLTCVDGANDGAQNHASFVVRNDAVTGDILVKINTNTYAAYNDYSYSTYTTDPVSGKDVFTPKVSKDRPNWLIHVQRWELSTIYWLERLGYRVSYCTDQDIHEKGEAYLCQFKIHLSSGHDEYWTKDQYKYVHNAVNAGLNIVLLGANAAYWVGRYEDNNRTYCIYKESVKGFDPSTILIHDPIEPTCRPRDSLLLNSPTENPDHRYPESRLWGAMYTNNGANIGFDYRINANRLDTTFALPSNTEYSGLDDPLFEGTGFKDNDSLPNCAGYEIDHISNSWMPEIKQGTKFRILNECAYPYPLQAGIFEPNWGLSWRSDPAHDGWIWTEKFQTNNFPPGSDQNLWQVGQTVYFERPNGAKCFASGHVMTPYCLAPSYMLELFGAAFPKESNAFGRLLQNVFTSMDIWGAYGSLEVIEGADLPDLIAEEGAQLSLIHSLIHEQKPHVPTEVNAGLSNGILCGSCEAIAEAARYRWQYSKDGAAFTGDRTTITNTVRWSALDSGSYSIRVQAINRAVRSEYSAASAAVKLTVRGGALSKLEAGARFAIVVVGQQNVSEKIYTIIEKRACGSMLIFDETRQLEFEWSVEVVNSYLFVQVVQGECG